MTPSPRPKTRRADIHDIPINVPGSIARTAINPDRPGITVCPVALQKIPAPSIAILAAANFPSAEAKTVTAAAIADFGAAHDAFAVPAAGYAGW